MTIYFKNKILENLAFQLRTKGSLKSSDLQKSTNLSQPQISRYLKLLEPQVIKIGKGKTTEYVHTRQVSQVGDRITVYRITTEGRLVKRGILYPILPKGFYWGSEIASTSKIYDDLPYFLNDLRPSGYLGRLIPRIYPEWEFPEDIRLWTSESTLRYLTHFGVDLVGDYIIGERAAEKFLQKNLEGPSRHENKDEIEVYEAHARRVEAEGIPGSSAGGEHPKFLTLRPSDGLPVIVKFVQNGSNEITQRRIDLIRAEHIAAELFVSRNQATSTRILKGDTYTFLEIDRFDRVGSVGRRGVISLLSLDAEFIGSGESWSVVARKLLHYKIIDKEILSEICLREYFGNLIGNTDMHGGNLSFFFEDEKILGLSPIYDMLPMKYSPIQEKISYEPIRLIAPRPSDIEIWKEATALAIRYWRLIQETKEFSLAFIEIAKRNESLIAGKNL